MMKTKHLFMMLCGGLVFASCSKHAEDQQITPPPGEFTITASQSNPSEQTRTELNGREVLWVDGDQLAVTASSLSSSESKAFNLTGGAGTKNGTFTGPALSAGKYISFYPFQTPPPVSSSSAFDISNQSQYENTSAHLGKYDFLYSEPVVLQEGAMTADFRFTHAFSLHELRIQLKSGSTQTDALIKKVSFVAHKADGTPVSKAFGMSVYYSETGEPIVADRTDAAAGIQVNTTIPLKSDAYFPVYVVLFHDDVDPLMYPYQIDLQIEVSSASAGNFTVTKENVKTVNAPGDEYKAGVKYVNTKTPIEVDAPEKHFPDANFRTYLKESLGCVETYNDIDPTDPKNQAVFSSTLEIAVDNMQIGSLKGIEYFSALINLRCGGNSLQTLDLSHNQKLISVLCDNNQLNALNVSGCQELLSLNCNANRLTSLDVSQNTKLEILNCEANQLSTLDVKTHIVLTDLNCQGNQMEELDITTLSGLKEAGSLGCGNQKNDAGNQLILSLSRTQYFTYWETGWKNNGKNSNVTAQAPVTYFPDAIFRAYLVTQGCVEEDLDIDPTKNTDALNKITAIQLISQKIESLKGIEYCPNLTRLVCNTNLLTQLDLSKNGALSLLSCDGNKLQTLDLSGNTDLITLYCVANKLTDLDVSKNTKLTGLHCEFNEMTSLDITMLAELKASEENPETLTCGGQTNHFSNELNLMLTQDQYTSYWPIWEANGYNDGVIPDKGAKYFPDVNFRVYLKSLGFIEKDGDIDPNGPTNSNLLAATKKIDVASKNITSLQGIEHFKVLNELYCNDNQLTVLNVSKNTTLTKLHCFNNKMKTLNITTLSELKSPDALGAGGQQNDTGNTLILNLTQSQNEQYWSTWELNGMNNGVTPEVK